MCRVSRHIWSACRHLNTVTGDAKNFHAWKYRSWLVQRAGKSPYDEEEFTKSLLEAEPSNFSALHHRLVALASAHEHATAHTHEHGDCRSADHSAEPPAVAEQRAPFGAETVAAHVSATEQAHPGASDIRSAPQEARGKSTSEGAPACACMRYSGASVLPIRLETLEREVKQALQVRQRALRQQAVAQGAMQAALRSKGRSAASRMVFRWFPRRPVVPVPSARDYL
jgi:hypothetical protein